MLGALSLPKREVEGHDRVKTRFPLLTSRCRAVTIQSESPLTLPSPPRGEEISMFALWPSCTPNGDPPSHVGFLPLPLGERIEVRGVVRFNCMDTAWPQSKSHQQSGPTWLILYAFRDGSSIGNPVNVEVSHIEPETIPMTCKKCMRCNCNRCFPQRNSEVAGQKRGPQKRGYTLATRITSRYSRRTLCRPFASNTRST